MSDSTPQNPKTDTLSYFGCPLTVSAYSVQCRRPKYRLLFSVGRDIPSGRYLLSVLVAVLQALRLNVPQLTLRSIRAGHMTRRRITTQRVFITSNLRRLLLERGMEQQDLARRASVSPRAISRLVNRRRVPRIECTVAAKICQVLSALRG